MSKTNTTIADVNRALENLGVDAKLHRDPDGYHYFYGTDVEYAATTSVAVCYTRSMTCAQWLDHARDFVYASWRCQAERFNTIPLDAVNCVVRIETPEGLLVVTRVEHDRSDDGRRAVITLHSPDYQRINATTLPIVMRALGPLLARWTRLRWPTAQFVSHSADTQCALIVLDCQ